MTHCIKNVKWNEMKMLFLLPRYGINEPKLSHEIVNFSISHPSSFCDYGFGKLLLLLTKLGT